ncbi:hypothetical protein CRD60_06775 [Bifidobacterium aemilianum]|uniref:Uncharacterized protein n=2 Tax=Bifidobacterium aemilianum TaxID=2493120 RepID=A0A366K8L1_9BIFI|nr:hypothetical protein CRD60_06775 [Bifidobacterium aemilianum]
MLRLSGRRTYLVFGLAAVLVGALLALVVTPFGRATGEEGATDNDFVIKVEAATGNGPNSKPTGTGSADDPVKVQLVDPFSSGQQQWNIKVTASQNQVGRIAFKFMDPDPNLKVKGKFVPTSAVAAGTLPNYSYYPDLFTQMRFTIYDGGQQLWTGKLGTDGAEDPSNPAANNPAAPGWLETKIPVSLQKGQTKTFIVKQFIDTTLSKDELFVYNGTTTGLNILVKGETR